MNTVSFFIKTQTKFILQDCLQVTKIEEGEDVSNFELFDENRCFSKDGEEKICILTITENEGKKKSLSLQQQRSIKDSKKPKNNQNCSLEDEGNKGKETKKKKGKKVIAEDSDNSDYNVDEDDDQVTISPTFYVHLFLPVDFCSILWRMA